MKKIICLLLSVFICFSFFACAKSESAPIDVSTIPSKEIVFLKTKNDADCALIKYNDKHILIDTGEKGDGKKIVEYLNNNGITRLDAIIFSHFDKDHCGGAVKILENIKVDEIVHPKYVDKKDESDDLFEIVRAQGIKDTVVENRLQRGDDNFSLTFLPPEKATYLEKQSNNSSLVVKVRIDSFTALFTGDSQEERVSELLESNEDLSADLLKLMYHGREVTNEVDLINNRIKPKYTIIPAEADSDKTEENIPNIAYALGECYYPTDGTVTFNLDNSTPQITQE